MESSASSHSCPSPRQRATHWCTVKMLTVCAFLALTGCSYLQSHTLDHCKTRAFVETNLEDYLNRRYLSGAPVRVGVIPFSAPENLTGNPNVARGIGQQMAHEVHAHMLNWDVFPIVEVLNRIDWPMKRDEFFTGNFGAISQARESGYDVVLIGYIEEFNPYQQLQVFTKLIEAESGTTLWYGQTTVTTERKDLYRGLDYLQIEDRDPSKNYSELLIDEASRCIVKEMKSRERPQG